MILDFQSSDFFTDQGIVGIPFVIDAGTSIEASNNYNGVRVNGYLVDGDYFSNCLLAQQIYH